MYVAVRQRLRLIRFVFNMEECDKVGKTSSSWLNCALRDDEAVYCVSIGHYEAVAVVN